MTLEAEDSTKNSNTQGTQEHQPTRDVMSGSELWTNGLICAFEFVRGKEASQKMDSGSKVQSGVSKLPKAVCRSHPYKPIHDTLMKKNIQEPTLPQDAETTNIDNSVGQSHSRQCLLNHSHSCEPRKYWVPIGWDRISELVQTVQVDNVMASQAKKIDDGDDLTVADVATPYWEPPVGPTWWAHVNAGYPQVNSWLSNGHWLHPAISTALRDESRLISERMKYLLYEVPVRVAGGLLFELLGQSVGDPSAEEDDIPIVLRSWQAQNFLLTALHVKGSSSNINVLGVSEVQELLAAGGSNIPRTVYGVIALLASRLARWDDRLFRKYIFGAADEVELKFMNRRTHEDLQLFSIILNQEIRRLSTQVIRVKWCLHAREEIVFELLQHLPGNYARTSLEGITKSTREMIQEQEAVRGRLFTIQDAMQSTVRAWLQDQSLQVQHNLGVFGGCGLILSIITGLFGINVDGMPGAAHAPYAFGVFSCALFLLGAFLIAIGLIYLGLRKPIMEEKAEVRRVELQELVRMFEQEAEGHAQVRKES